MINHPNRSKTITEPVLTMTLGDIRRKGPCQKGWLKLIRAVGDDPKTVVSLGDIALSNDAADAIWCTRALDWSDIAVRRTVKKLDLNPVAYAGNGSHILASEMARMIDEHLQGGM